MTVGELLDYLSKLPRDMDPQTSLAELIEEGAEVQRSLDRHRLP